jgi:hypothetical protein
MNMRKLLVALVVGALGIFIWGCASPAGGLIFNDAGLMYEPTSGTWVDIRIRIWVGAATQHGFVSGPGVVSSVEDVQERFRSKKAFSGGGLAPDRIFLLVDDPKQAVMLVTITDRGIGQEQYGQRSIIRYGYYNTQVVTVPMVQNTFWVDAVREIIMPDGTIDRREIVGRDFKDWSGCATEIASSTRDWTVSNWSKLVELKPARNESR